MQSRPATSGNIFGLMNKIVHGCVSRFVGSVAHVQTQSRLSGDYVACTGLGLNGANRGHQSESILRSTLRPALDCTNPLGSGGEGIMAQVHRRSSRVIGMAGECELQTALAG